MTDFALSVKSQFPGMGKFAAADRSHLVSGDGHDGGRFPRESHKLDLKRFVPRINVNHRPDVTGFETVGGEGCGHGEGCVVDVDHAVALAGSTTKNAGTAAGAFTDVTTSELVSSRARA